MFTNPNDYYASTDFHSINDKLSESLSNFPIFLQIKFIFLQFKSMKKKAKETLPIKLLQKTASHKFQTCKI